MQKQDEQLVAQSGMKQCCGGSSVAYGSGHASNVNVNTVERALSVVGGGLLLKHNLRRAFSLPGLVKLAAGSALMRRGLSGHCNVYEAMHVSSARENEHSYPGASAKAQTLRVAITVQMPPLQTYEMWRDPANQGWIMGPIAQVEAISMDRAHWTLRRPFGMKLEWETMIVADAPGEYLSWESLPGAAIPNEGTVRFVHTETGGTRVICECRFDPPAGALGLGLMKLLGYTPEAVMGKALRRFKSMAEMGMPAAPMGPAKLKPQYAQKGTPVGV